ncbi:hypothetical protein ASD56_06375 [Microbacterium sp. Root166]|uniref:SIR2 family protein n=1 Tax=Microbacterium sp. Root166 TaxID=1736478 RepID=UPI0006F488B7|nr:SIR2 family protein [Microbacterium sp. Root166]KQZ85902.1 hypothetical protein ASD56_06375 [Microbacterium sp. Root166]
MWITGAVDVPDDLITSLEEGNLVIFVGAGASMDDPSGLPNFNTLADLIASSHSTKTRGTRPADQFLSDLRDDGVDVHTHAATVIAAPTSLPNRNHAALAEIAASGPAPRIVTTNYDMHLSQAATGLGREFLVYAAPALPLGHDFDGIVHVHGALSGAPKALVLTDADFGRAYLTEGWAARFLNDLFRRYVVLFVGYSHEDVVMTYLARGLHGSQPRFALVSAADQHDWRRLGITPIIYPSSGHDHSALTDLLEEWARRAKMGALDHTERVRQLVSGRPPLSPVENDYLLRVIRTEVGARAFERNAGREWLAWIASSELFAESVTASGRVGASAGLMITWFVRHFATETEGLAEGLQAIRQFDQMALGDTFVTALLTTLAATDSSDRTVAGAWLSALSQRIRTDTSNTLQYQLRGLTFPEDSDVAAILLDVLLTPRVTLDEPFRLFEPDRARLPRAEIVWVPDEYWLREFWNSLATEQARELFADAANRALILAYSLLNAHGGPNASDGAAWWRPAIEPHEQNGDSLVDILIDSLRDRADRVGGSEGAEALQSSWWSTGHKLFRRLSVYLEGVRTDHDADARVAWLLRQSLIHDFDVKHEVFWLLGRNAAEISASTSANLIDAALARPSFGAVDVDGRHRQYAIYNLLTWLEQHAPGMPGLADASESIKAANPDFLPREHPDFDVYMTTGTWEDRPPAPLDDFRSRVQDDAEAALEWLQSQNYSSTDFDAVSSDGAARLVSGLAKESPRLVVRLWHTAVAQGDQPVDVRAAILDGWNAAELDGDAWREVIGALSTATTTDQQDRSLARLLQTAVAESQPDDAIAERATTIAEALVQSRAAAYATSAESSLMLGLNSWPGTIAQMWTTFFSRLWSANRDAWRGIPDQYHDAILAITLAVDETAKATHPVLAAEVYFLFAADEDFTTRHLIPLFDPASNPHTVLGVWDAYTHGPRLNDRMIAAGFLDVLLRGAPVAEQLPKHLFNNYCSLLVSALLYGGIAEDQRSVAIRSIFTGSSALRETVVELLVAKLTEFDYGDSAGAWDTWVAQLVAARAGGSPSPIAETEKARWNAIYAAIPDRADEVSLALELLAGPFSLRLPPSSYARLEALARTHPRATHRFLKHSLISCAAADGFSLSRLEETVRLLVAALGTNELRPIVDRLVGLGAHEAESWLSP